VSAAARARTLLPAVWLGGMLSVALLAAPAAFAVLPAADAGRVVGRLLTGEAYASLVLGAVLAALLRLRDRAGGGTQFSTDQVLVLAALFLTVLGHFGLQPMVAAARAGQGALSFGQVHALSVALFGLKGVAVAALAWRQAGTRA
jgi:Domain of unknown function (DUF4149)